MENLHLDLAPEIERRFIYPPDTWPPHPDPWPPRPWPCPPDPWPPRPRPWTVPDPWLGHNPGLIRDPIRDFGRPNMRY